MRLLKEKLASVGITVREDQLVGFQKYHDLILEWNKRTNLVSQKDETRIVERHFLESLAVLVDYHLKENSLVLDVGSGGGFPAIPLSLMRPDLKFFLVESKRMKVLFLRLAVSRLRLNNVFVFGVRCEEFAGDKKYHRYFDYALSRAVAGLDQVYGWVESLLKSDGVYIAWKGGVVRPEIDALCSRFDSVKVNEVKMDDRLVDKRRDRSLVIVQQA